MRIYKAVKNGGKTSFLIKESAKTGYLIIASDSEQISVIKQIAYDLCISIPEPITFAEYLANVVYGKIDPDQKFLIDDLDCILQKLHIDLATISSRNLYYVPGYKHMKGD